MESRREEPPPVPEASERLLTQSTRALRLARELALSADSSTIAQLLARHVGEIAGGGPTAVYLLGAGRAPLQAAASGFLARQPPGPPRVVERCFEGGRLVAAAAGEVGELDGYGVSRGLARTLAEQCRAGEEPFRVGGDEFAVVVDGEAAAGIQLADRIRRATAQHLVGQTLSAGVASFPADARSKEELVSKADLALLAAKRGGKDTAITFADDGDAGAAGTSLDVLYRELRERMGESGFRDAALRELWNAGRALARERTREGMLAAASKHLSVLLRATACAMSKLDGETLVDAAVYVPAPWRLH